MGIEHLDSMFLEVFSEEELEKIIEKVAFFGREWLLFVGETGVFEVTLSNGKIKIEWLSCNEEGDRLMVKEDFLKMLEHFKKQPIVCINVDA